MSATRPGPADINTLAKKADSRRSIKSSAIDVLSAVGMTNTRKRKSADMQIGCMLPELAWLRLYLKRAKKKKKKKEKEKKYEEYEEYEEKKKGIIHHAYA